MSDFSVNETAITRTKKQRNKKTQIKKRTSEEVLT
jgi:hypothetical protein